MPQFNVDIYVNDIFIYSRVVPALDAEIAENIVEESINVQFDTTEIL